MGKLTLDDMTGYVNSFYYEKQEERREALESRDFRDGKQLTDAERRELRRKGIPDTVIDKIGPKIGHLQGVELNMQIGPECQPVTFDDIESCSVARYSIEYVLNANAYKAKRSKAFDSQLTEGMAGYYVYLKEKMKRNGDKFLDVAFDAIKQRDAVYDPMSCEDHFEDAKFLGFRKFMDVDDAKRIFKGKDEIIDGVSTVNFGDTYDKEWYIQTRDRVAVMLLNVKHEGQWWEAVFTSAGFLMKPRVSLFQNDDYESLPSVIMTSAYVDSEGDRYGMVRRMKDPQRIYNKSHQMATHAIRSTQVAVRQDVYNDKKRLATIRLEATRADGVIPFMESPDEVTMMDNSAKVNGNLQLAQQAEVSLDMYGANSSLTGDFEGDASGVALEHRANKGTVELSRIFANHKDLLVRLYKTIWFAAKDYWPENKMIRISGMEKAPKFIELNRPLPSLKDVALKHFGMIPQHIIDEAREKDVDLEAPRVENQLKMINVDIVITETENHADMAATQFEVLKELHLSQPEIVTAIDVIKASNLANKDEIIERHEQQQEQSGQAQQEQMRQQEELQNNQMQAMSNALNAQAQKDQLDIQQKQQKIMIDASQAKVDNEKTVAETTKIYHDMNEEPKEEKQRVRVQAGF